MASPGLKVVVAGSKEKSFLAKPKLDAWRSFIKAFS